jgi:hypothetical protein
MGSNRNGTTQSLGLLAAEVAAQWPTPAACQDKQGQNEADGKRGQTLVGAARGQSWPTPSAAVMNDGESLASWEARRERNLAKSVNGNGMGTPLTIAAQAWPTPAATEVRQGYQRRATGQASRQNQQSLTTWAVDFPSSPPAPPTASPGPPSSPPGPTSPPLWPTPNVPNGGRQAREMSATGQTPNGKRQVDLRQYAREHGPTAGEKRRLNPRFVSWLMGLPPGWLDALSSCGREEMASYRSRLRSRLACLLGDSASTSVAD